MLPAPSAALLADAQRLVGRDGHDLVQRRTGLVGQSAHRGESSEHALQSSVVFSRGFEEWDPLTEDVYRFWPADDSLRPQICFIPAYH